MKRITPIKDSQTVQPDGTSVKKMIHGLVVRPARTQQDQRGELVEVYNPAWRIHSEPMVYAYQATVRPGAVKGWVKHKLQDDRIYACLGTQRWVFFDDRKNSATYKMLNEFVFGERNRALVIVPKGVYHAVQNIGATEALFFNLPTRPYNHASPDKYRLPPKNNLIPFDFDRKPAW